ncbi:MAG: peptidoglycan recognition protein family protein [Myxococcota bacterium]
MLRHTLLVAVALSLFAVSGCSKSSTPQPDPNQTEQGQGHLHAERIETFEAHSQLAKGQAVLEREDTFEQVGFHYATESTQTPRYRVRHTDGQWGDWRELNVTWSEGPFRVARILLDEEAEALELDGAEGIRSGKIEFYEDVVARVDMLTRDLPLAGSPEVSLDGEALARQQVAPDSLVIPRADWGARDPDRVCGSAHDPYRMSIHHTYLPADDGGDPAAAMRSIQAYHIDSNGWCDIGYHFVVSQSGNIYQGRSSEQRTGAHVGGQNTGNIGICLIGDFTSQTPQQQQLTPTADIVRWVGDTYGIGFDRNSVKGHREWPGQSTSCPGGNLLAQLDSILAEADGGGVPDNPDPLEIQVNYLGADNFYGQGSSSSLPDALPGDTFQAELLLTNTTGQVIRDVYLGYLIEGPYVVATEYAIYSDHPALDKSTWEINSADDAEDNPAGDQLGQTGKLNMHAFSAGETKRVVLELEAGRYSYGQHDHPDVRAWLNTATDDNGSKLYGDQNSWDEDPATNRFGDWVRDYAQMDILAEDRWTFDDNSDPANLEGWTGRGDFEELHANNSDSGMIAQRINGGDPGIVSPAWTRIDAETYDQLVLSYRSHDGPHTKEIYWAGEGESFSEDRVVRFEVPGDGETHEVVVPIGQHEGWSGSVTQLRVDLYDGAAPAEEANRWYDVDHIFFQDSESQMTTTGGDYAAATPVELGADDDGSGDGGDGGDDGTGGNDGDNDGSGDGTPDQTGDNDVQVKGGCSSTGDGAPVSAALVLLAAIAALTRRRRR